MRRRLMRSLIATPAICIAVVVGTSGCSYFGLQDYVEFTPPPAQIQSRADCGLADITSALGDPDNSPVGDVDGEGSIPDGFTAERVVRCERGVDTSGRLTVDAVTLVGDIGAVSAAFDQRSQRNPDGVSTSCPFGSRVPAGLWLEAADGSAVRPQWPRVICGFRDEPMSALKLMREVGRTTVTSIESPSYGRGCAASAPYVFRATTTSDRARSGRDKTRLLMPTDDVDALTVCGYRNYGEYSTFTGSRRLSVADSRRVAVAGTTAPPASACDRTASEVVALRLLRPDGSGGGQMLVEIDGCRRVMTSIPNTYSAMPSAAMDLLRN